MAAIKKTTSEVIFIWFNGIFMVLFCITIIFPIMQQITISLSTPIEAVKPGLHLVPTKITFQSYQRLFSTGLLLNSYFNTLFRVIVGTLITLLITTMMAYPLSKKHMPNITFFTFVVVFTMFFDGGMIPNYLLVKNLHLIDTRWALVLPGAVSAFYVIIIRNFFMSIPAELEESARIDGASDIMILFRIILPLSKPVMATVSLWSIVGHWNAWFDAVIYINDSAKQVVMVLLRQMLLEGRGFFDNYGDFTQLIEQRKITPETVRSAMFVTVTLPILLIYPFLQKYYIKGIMLGSIKG